MRYPRAPDEGWEADEDVRHQGGVTEAVLVVDVVDPALAIGTERDDSEHRGGDDFVSFFTHADFSIVRPHRLPSLFVAYELVSP